MGVGGVDLKVCHGSQKRTACCDKRIVFSIAKLIPQFKEREKECQPVVGGDKEKVVPAVN